MLLKSDKLGQNKLFLPENCVPTKRLKWLKIYKTIYVLNAITLEKLTYDCILVNTYSEYILYTYVYKWIFVKKDISIFLTTFQ